ncbi:dihydrofolate reductase [Rhizobium sp. Root1203]|uniref:2-hydroxyacid dehydrogenase n=1 Tax=Rhizobium sp. Root1203 TaxID=1736427 RepID=UPI00070AF172|nr:2-hydroxyacid dehydrogenase [Rhizobium sp. Root1203]KQV14339.1 dihydrofolate reductase [Rhizobium sp. Root1203]
MMPIVEVGAAELNRRYRVCRFYEVDDTRSWLEKYGPKVRVVVTAGHIGVPNDLIDRLPALELIAIAGVGYEKVDLALTRRRAIRVSNTPDVLTEDVADCAIGLMIAAMRRLTTSDAFVRTGQWRGGDMPLSRRVSGLRYGIFGLGRIGQAVARRLEGFGGTIGYCARSAKDVPYRHYSSVLDLALNSDVMILTAAASEALVGCIDEQVLTALGPQGYLVNVARGSLVDEDALISCLSTGRLCGAGIDVYANEPNVPETLIALSNVVLSPHIGSATAQAREAMAELMLDNIAALFAGRPLPSQVS